MAPEQLIEAIKAADLGPFREVRLITLVHQKGVTPEVRERVAQEIEEVNDKEAAENEHLQDCIKGLETCLEDLEKIEVATKRVRAIKQKTVAA